MATAYSSAKEKHRPEGHVVTSAAYFAEGVNQVTLEAEIYLDPADPISYVEFWLSPAETGGSWKGPFLTSEINPLDSKYLMRTPTRGGNGFALFSTGTIDLGAYTGVVRWHMRLVSSDGTSSPVVYDVKVKSAQSVASNIMPPRYYWMNTLAYGEANDLGIDNERSHNYSASATSLAKRLTLMTPSEAATIQGLAYDVVNPVDLLKLDVVNPASISAARVDQILRDGAGQPFAKSVFTAGKTMAAATYGADGLSATLTLNGDKEIWLKKKADASWAGFEKDFDLEFEFFSQFGDYKDALGNQHAGVMLYSASENNNPWDGTVNNYLKCYVADDGRAYLETDLNNEGVSVVSKDRNEGSQDPMKRASGVFRVVRVGNQVSVFYKPSAATRDPKLSDGAYLLRTFELSDGLHLSYYAKGPLNASSSMNTTHIVSIDYAKRGAIPDGVAFWVSNDNGATWKEACPGIPTYMGKTGDKLRWHVDVEAGKPFDLRALSLNGVSYLIKDFSTLRPYTSQMLADAAASTDGLTYTRYLYWRELNKDQSQIFFEEALRESTQLEALIAKITFHLGTDGTVSMLDLVNYKNKVSMSAQGTLLHQAYKIMEPVDAQNRLSETLLAVAPTGAVSGQKKSGHYLLEILQAVDANGDDLEGEIAIRWNETYLEVGGEQTFPFAAASGARTITDPEAGTLSFTVGTELPPSLPRRDVIWVIDSRPETPESIQEQITLNWGRRPSVITVFDGHPDTKVIQNTISHEGFTAHKAGGFTLPDGTRMSGFWRAETEW